MIKKKELSIEELKAVNGGADGKPNISFKYPIGYHVELKTIGFLGKYYATAGCRVAEREYRYCGGGKYSRYYYLITDRDVDTLNGWYAQSELSSEGVWNEYYKKVEVYDWE